MNFANPSDLERWNNEIYSIGTRIIELARSSNVKISFIGGCAIWSINKYYHNFLCENKRIIKDIDFFSISKWKVDINDILLKEGFILEIASPSISYIRSTYWRENIKVEVYFNKLNFSQNINSQLNLDDIDGDSLSLGLLFLTKIQIYNFTFTDYIDVIVILWELSKYDRGKLDKEINVIISNTTNDWNFYHAVYVNTTKIKSFIGTNEIEVNNRASLMHVLDQIVKRITDSRKTLRWKVRSLFGEKISWHNEIV